MKFTTSILAVWIFLSIVLWIVSPGVSFYNYMTNPIVLWGTFAHGCVEVLLLAMESKFRRQIQAKYKKIQKK